MRSGFPGFPEEAIAFYRSLARNNRREWFQPRKSLYDLKVKAPMVELVTALDQAMMQFAPDYVTDPANAIYRIYRDTRFSPDKPPFKTQIAPSFTRRGLEKHGAAGYYFAVSHKGLDVGGGIYMPPSETLLAVRTHIAANHVEFLRLLAARPVKRLFGAIQGEQLTRLPKGFACDHPAAGLLRFKQFLLFTTLGPEIITTPKLYAALETHFRALTPFMEFLNAPLVGARRPSAPLDYLA